MIILFLDLRYKYDRTFRHKYFNYLQEISKIVTQEISSFYATINIVFNLIFYL